MYRPPLATRDAKKPPEFNYAAPLRQAKPLEKGTIRRQNIEKSECWIQKYHLFSSLSW